MFRFLIKTITTTCVYVCYIPNVFMDPLFFQGNTKKWLREECDKRFLHDMHRICRTAYRKWYEKTTRANCKAYAKTYYKLVSVTGRKYYDKVSPTWCTKDCVVSKGSPNIKYQENLQMLVQFQKVEYFFAYLLITQRVTCMKIAWRRKDFFLKSPRFPIANVNSGIGFTIPRNCKSLT